MRTLKLDNSGVVIGVNPGDITADLSDPAKVFRGSRGQAISYYFTNNSGESRRVIVRHDGRCIWGDSPGCGMASETALLLIPGREVLLDRYFVDGRLGMMIAAPMNRVRVIVLGDGTVKSNGFVVVPRINLKIGFGNTASGVQWSWRQDTGRGKLPLADWEVEF